MGNVGGNGYMAWSSTSSAKPNDPKNLTRRAQIQPSRELQ